MIHDSSKYLIDMESVAAQYDVIVAYRETRALEQR